MKTIFKHPGHFWFVLALCAMIFSGSICIVSMLYPKPIPDPLIGFHAASQNTDSAIEKDNQNYIKNLSAEEKTNVVYFGYFEDGAGQYAVRIAIRLNQLDWRHVLIYDKDNKRIKTIKYIRVNDGSYELPK